LSEAKTPEEEADSRARARKIAHHSLEFVLDVACHGIPGLKTLDSLLMMAINQANIAPLTRNPEARSRYGGLAAPAPDAERRPVSVRAVAASMRLPYETARRNIRRLEAQGVCILSPAGVVVPATFMRSVEYLEAAQDCYHRMQALYVTLRAASLLDALPASHYVDDEPPVRGAVRLMSDYLLRTSEVLVARTGGIVSGVILTPLLSQAAGALPGSAAGLSMAAISRRVQTPAETVRRQIAALVAEGACEIRAGRVMLTDHQLTGEAWSGLLRDNAINVHRLFAGLAERGLVEAWDRAAGFDPARVKGIA